jgi:hypothetical protein
VRRLLLIVALVAAALMVSVLPTSFATPHGQHVSRHRALMAASRPDDAQVPIPVITQSPDSDDQPVDMLIGKRLVVDAVTFGVETPTRTVVNRQPPVRGTPLPLNRAELQIWRV